MIATALTIIGQLALYLGLAPLLTGIARRTRRWADGHEAGSIFQDYFDLLKWLYRPPIRPVYGTVFGRLGPPLSLAIVLTAGLEIPSLLRHPPLVIGDLLAAIIVLTISHASHLLTLYDTDAPPITGRGWRLPAGPPLVEPIVALALLGPIVGAGSADPAAVSAAGGGLATPTGALACAALIVVAMVVYETVPGGMRGSSTPEGGASPALTGRDLAMIRWAAFAKAQVILSLATCAFLPIRPADRFGSAGAFLASLALYLAKVALLAAACGLGRAAIGRSGQPVGGHLLALAASLAALGLACGAILHA